MFKSVALALVMLAAGTFFGIWIADSDPPDGREETSTFRCPMHPTVVSDRAGSCPVCGMDLVEDQPDGNGTPMGKRKIAHWRAPMDPSYTSNSPGKSPMGMDLIPVYEDESETGGTVRIDPVVVQNMGVKIYSAERKSLSRVIRTVGRVDYDETRMTDVNTKVDGWVERLFVDYTGQSLQKGQPLLEIYSPELVAAQEEYLTAYDYQQRLARNPDDEIVQGAKDLLTAATQRLRYWDITDRQIADLRLTRAANRTMTLYSPQEGIVVHKAVFDGAYIKSGQHLYRIGDLSNVWVYANVYEYELPWVRVGQKAEVELSYLPGKTFNGKVTHVYPFLDSKTRTVKVRMSLPNPDLELKPEMYANVRIKSMVSREALVVPVQAVIRSGERNVLIVALGEGRFQPRDVKLGVEAEGFLQILDGLSAGEQVVSSGQFLIDSESNLKAALSSLGSGHAADETAQGEHAAHGTH
jgi:RND family efflux transporter MFP subunit